MGGLLLEEYFYVLLVNITFENFISLSFVCAFSCHHFLSIAGAEAMFAHLGHFTATSIRVCAVDKRGFNTFNSM